MNAHGAFLYAPAVAQLLAPLQLVPWPVFLVGWTMLLGMLLAWMCRGVAALVFLVPFVAIEILAGNIHLVLAAAVVAGFRWPAAWSFVILTKVTPAIGLLWFVARREWRPVAIALGVTLAIVGVSAVLAPGRWTEWLARLSASADQHAVWPATLLPGLATRIVLAAGIAMLAGMAGWRWPVIVSVMVALPNPAFISPALLVGVIPLALLDRREPLPARWPGRPGHARSLDPVQARS